MGRDLDAYFIVNGKMVHPLPTFVATSFASPTTAAMTERDWEEVAVARRKKSLRD